MDDRKNRKAAAVIGMILLLALAAAVGFVAARRFPGKAAEAAEPEKTAALGEFWAPDSAAAADLRDYVARVTDPAGGADFIPEEDRIAVFDMDGTLTCETYYTYYDTMMFIEYCLVDHPERVSDELKQIAAAIRPGYTADETLARNFARAYAGLTVEEFRDYAVEFGKKPTESFTGMRYIDGFYLPMVELVRWLYDNGFTIYVISGTERTTTRAIVANSPIAAYVSPEHVIGTDFEVKQKGYENEPSNLNFKYEDGDELVLTGGFIQKNLNGNKSIYVEREIGQRPVLAFGNSGSDTSMMNYAIDGRNPYPARAYMVVADDDVREWGTQDWETKSADWAAKGYVPISMKNDFAAIYPEGVKKAEEQFHERAWNGGQEETAAAPDYGDEGNWAYFALGEDKPADLFLICPTVDVRDEFNMAMDDEKTKANFLGALNMERGIYEGSARMYAPYYRQAAMKAYAMTAEEREPYLQIAYEDVSAAFAWYLEHENGGRPIVLAGFSQGGGHVLPPAGGVFRPGRAAGSAGGRVRHRLALHAGDDGEVSADPAGHRGGRRGRRDQLRLRGAGGERDLHRAGGDGGLRHQPAELAHGRDARGPERESRLLLHGLQRGRHAGRGGAVRVLHRRSARRSEGHGPFRRRLAAHRAGPARGGLSRVRLPVLLSGAAGQRADPCRGVPRRGAGPQPRRVTGGTAGRQRTDLPEENLSAALMIQDMLPEARYYHDRLRAVISGLL